MVATEGQSLLGFEERALIREISAHLSSLLSLFHANSPSSSFEKIEKAKLLAFGLADAAENGQSPPLFPILRMLSLLNRAFRSLDDEAGAGAGPIAAAAADTARILVSRMGRNRARFSPMTNMGAGEILPPERLAQTKPGKILLALEPALAENIAMILRRFGHTVLIAHAAKDVFAELGFFAGQPEKTSALTLFHASGEGLASYSLPRATAVLASRRESLPDIVLGDMFSAGFAGFELQEMLKSCGEFVDTRIIIVSPFDESKCVARAIQLGADDYLGWDVEPSVLLARIESSIERKRLRARRQLYAAALARARESLEEELKRGAEYVRCLLPGKISGAAMSTDWAFIPSANLGGDLFGYHRLDDGRMVFFMIDVSGHGVQSALYSVTIFDVLRTEGLKDVDFGDPVSVMRGLNHAFRMEERNNMLFTLWYGVWDEKTRMLSHASAGSPPAVLIVQGGGAIELKAEGMVAGADSEAIYRKLDIQVPRESRLFLFSDGIYEFITREGAILGVEAFIQLLERTAADTPHGNTSIKNILERLASLSDVDHFQDDVSLLEVRFD